METVRIGIVGVGGMGSVHAACIHRGEIEGMTLTALCDTDEAKRAKLAETYPEMPVFETHGALLASGLTDAVLVATPHCFHTSIAMDGLEAGQHVLTEKPADVSVQKVLALNELAAQSGKIFGIMFNQRTNGLFRKAREIVQGGQLGHPKRLIWIVTNWYRSQGYYDSGAWRATWCGEGGGVLLNQAPHNLDILQWIFGMPRRVRAFCAEGKYHNIEVEDDATVYAEYENGAAATFITTTGECPGTNRLEISGDRGKLVLEEGKLRWWKLASSEREFCFRADANECKRDVEYTEHVPDAPDAGHRGILRNFARAVLYGDELIAPGCDGVNQLTLTNAAYLSSWTDEWVTIPLDAERYETMLREKIAASSRTARFISDISTGTQYKERWQVNW